MRDRYDRGQALMSDTLQPKGEALRRAVRWISEQGDHSPDAVEEAARRFDLSPADEEFLLRHFANRAKGQN